MYLVVAPAHSCLCPDIASEPAFRDIWRDGIPSYLPYLRDQLTVAHEILTESRSGGQFWTETLACGSV